MQAEIAVNTVTLGGKVGDLNDDLNKLRGNIGKMYEAVEALDRMWDGPANDTFRAQFMNDKNDMDELFGEIQKVFDSMETAKKEYEICEGDVSQMIASIRI
ncbi:MAG: hypothetical protein IKI75_12170 [Lachnospiraceae bacterium]|nr:hypothetical protein [Lachnospiraceae bacterium]